MATNYTPELVAAIEALGKAGPITFAMATEFAEANDLKPRSVVAKVKSLGLAYEPKPVKVTKRGEPTVAKAEIVAAIEAAVKVSMPSLAKATKEDLAKLRDALSA